jgi:PTS system ascorbate-specific IIB component
MAEIRKVMCCCGQGLGSSMMVEMNIQKALKKLGKEGVASGHTSLSEINPDAADLFVVGRDLAPQLKKFPRVIVLKKIMSVAELTEKLERAFAETADTFFIE